MSKCRKNLFGINFSTSKSLMKSSKKEITKEITIKNSLTVGIILLVLMWIVFLVEWAANYSFGQYGILPRTKSGLWGILFAPFIHGDWNHIINNSPPIFILTSALFYFYRKIAFEVLSLSALIGGLFVWIAARESYHIGMSGVIYSLAFFLFFSGVIRKDLKLLAISLFVVFLYGSMVWGLLPLQQGVSFESHLFGAITGTAFAYIYRKNGETFKRKKYQFEIDEENDAKLKAQGYKKITDEFGFTIKYIHQDDEN